MYPLTAPRSKGFATGRLEGYVSSRKPVSFFIFCLLGGPLRAHVGAPFRPLFPPCAAAAYTVPTVDSCKPPPGGEVCCVVGGVTVQCWRYGRHYRARYKLALFDGTVEEHLSGPIRVEGALYIVAIPWVVGVQTLWSRCRTATWTPAGGNSSHPAFCLVLFLGC